MKKKAQITILAQSIYSSIKNKSKQEAEKIVQNFLAYLKQKRLVNLSSGILAKLEELYFDDNNIVAVEVTAKTELSEEELKQIIKLVAAKTGREVRIKQKIDRSLIGGAVIRYQDKIIDISLKNQLNKLSKKLIT